MPSMFDMTCSVCHKRYGFAGEKMADAPPCPKCGAVPDKVELEKTDAALDRARAEMFAEFEKEKSK